MADAILIDTIEKARALGEFFISLGPDGAPRAAWAPGRVPPETRIGMMLTHTVIPVSEAIRLRGWLTDLADTLGDDAIVDDHAQDLLRWAELVLPSVLLDRQAEWSDSGVGYCTVHDGVVEVDADLCDRVGDDDQPGEDGEPRPCDIRPLFYPGAPKTENAS